MEISKQKYLGNHKLYPYNFHIPYSFNPLSHSFCRYPVKSLGRAQFTVKIDPLFSATVPESVAVHTTLRLAATYSSPPDPVAVYTTLRLVAQYHHRAQWLYGFHMLLMLKGHVKL